MRSVFLDVSVRIPDDAIIPPFVVLDDIGNDELSITIYNISTRYIKTGLVCVIKNKFE